ncbi:MAG: polymer-forming cytoskeletal protein [Spirochaetales bacterium]|nr:polymer-forming cytoskeletal protein [Spirochaetales bacterium]
MAKINEHKGLERIRTILGKETEFNGIMKFQDSLKINGRFKGEIVSPGFLYIENGAEVKANINVGSVIIGGVVKGNVTAKNKLEMLETGKVFGNIRTAKLKIADGVVFEGKCEMIKNPEKIDIFTENVDQIKKNVEYV